MFNYMDDINALIVYESKPDNQIGIIWIILLLFS